MPSNSGLTTGKETQHEVHRHQQYQPCNTNVVVHLDQTSRDAEHPGPNDASQGFPERELPRFRKEASILRTETFGSQRKSHKKGEIVDWSFFYPDGLKKERAENQIRGGRRNNVQISTNEQRGQTEQAKHRLCTLLHLMGHE